MKKLLLFLICHFSINILGAQSVFINEIHYDNDGGDVGEGWEISAPAGTDLSCYSILLYNGSNGEIYNTIVLNGIVDDEGCGYGSISFSQSSIQNGGPDGIALYNTCTSTLVQFLSYEGSFSATNGLINGESSTNIGVSETGSTPIGHSLQLTGSGTDYGNFTWQAASANSMGSINSGQDFCACTGTVAEPTNEATGLTVGSIACVSAQISWTNGTGSDNSIVVISTSAITGTPNDGDAYTASGGYGSGDVLNAGEYIIYNGTGNAVNVSNLAEGTTYFITIFEYNGSLANCEENYLTGGVSSSFSTITGCTSTTPQIESILYNSCNGANEGIDEIFTFQTGSDGIAIDSILIEYPNGDDFCNIGCGANTNLNNPTYLSDLNIMAGCTVFAYADPIPPNADVMVFTGNPPSTVLDYSSQCGAANLPIYVLFNNNTGTDGRFSNTAIRELIVNFGNGMSDSVTYNGSSQSNTDGATVNFDQEGNPTYFISTDCVYPLPIELLYLKGENNDNYTTIKWATATERNNDYFVVEKSTDGINFSAIGTVNGNGNSSQQIDYSFIDNSPTALSYYRLKQMNFDGEFQYSYMIKVMNSNSQVYYSNNELHFDLSTNANQNYTVNIYNLNGQLVHTSSTIDANIINWTKKGLYIIEIPELDLRQKLSCH